MLGRISLCRTETRLFFAELCQDAASRFRVQECDVQTIGTIAGSLVDEANALLVAHSQSLGDTILDLKGNVVNTLATIVQELLYGAFGASGFQQFQLNFANLQESGLYFLVLNNFGLVNLQAQYVLEIGQYGVDALYGNAQMFDS